LKLKVNGTEMARCSKCSDACGDDYKTLTKYAEEKNIGDRMKVILLQLNDIVEVDNLQISEMTALVMDLIKQHYDEEDAE
jgi:hypothetical protein